MRQITSCNWCACSIDATMLGAALFWSLTGMCCSGAMTSMCCCWCHAAGGRALVRASLASFSAYPVSKKMVRHVI